MLLLNDGILDALLSRLPLEGLGVYGWDAQWLDAFDTHSHTAPGLLPGRVAEQQAHMYRLCTAMGETWAEVPRRLLRAAEGLGDLPAVGDWVAYRPGESGCAVFIEAVLPRRSKFSRKAAGARPDEQVVAANIDTLLIVTAAVGDFHPRKLERYLVLAWESGASPVVVLSKADLHPNIGEVVAQAEGVAMSAPIVPVCCLSGEGIAGLMPLVKPGRTLALLGSSGVGKSTIVNALLGSGVQRTNGLRSDGKGRHTTTHRELFVLPGGGLIVDTPGMREMHLWEASEGLQSAFADVEDLALGCRFRDCRHQSEPQCAVKLALRDGTLDEGRYRSYLSLQRELAHLDRKRGVKRRS